MSKPAPSSPSRLVVFSHGNSFPASTYTMLLDSLRERGFTVAAIDQYGHDPKYPVTNNWPHLVEQLHDTVQREARRHGGKAWLVGHSLGGFLSLMCAAQHPELAEGVVMMDSPVVSGWRANALNVAKRVPMAEALSPGAKSRRRRNSWPSREAAIEHFRHKKVFAKWHPKVLEDYIDHGTREDAATGERLLSFDRDVETAIYNTLPHNLDTLLKRHPLKVPVYFIGGTRSTEIRQVGLAATQKLTKGRIAMLDGTHLFPMEKPLVAAAAVAMALQELHDGR